MGIGENCNSGHRRGNERENEQRASQATETAAPSARPSNNENDFVRRRFPTDHPEAPRKADLQQPRQVGAMNSRDPPLAQWSVSPSPISPTSPRHPSSPLHPRIAPVARYPHVSRRSPSSPAASRHPPPHHATNPPPPEPRFANCMPRTRHPIGRHGPWCRPSFSPAVATWALRTRHPSGCRTGASRLLETRNGAAGGGAGGRAQGGGDLRGGNARVACARVVQLVQVRRRSPRGAFCGKSHGAPSVATGGFVCRGQLGFDRHEVRPRFVRHPSLARADPRSLCMGAVVHLWRSVHVSLPPARGGVNVAD